MSYRDQLWGIALDQHGFVTAQDALDLDIPKVELPKLHHRGLVERVDHGVYRFPQMPVDQYAPYMQAVLWTGVKPTYLSHETALAVREVCDMNPARIHITIPRGHRIRREGADRYVVHAEELEPDEVGWWEGIPAVKLATAIAQCIAYGTPTYLLRQALDNAASTSALTPDHTRMLWARLELRHAG